MVKGLATFPSSQRRGGCAVGADGVARSASPIGRSLNRRSAHHVFAGLTTPSARTRVASRYFLDCAATPPLRGGE